MSINKIIFSRIKISIKNVPLKNLVFSCKSNLQIQMLTEQIVVLTGFAEAGCSIGSLPQNQVVQNYTV